MSADVIIEALARISDTVTREDVVIEIGHAVASLNCPYFVLLKGPRHIGDISDFILASRSPENWQKVYAAKRYLTVDPRLRYLTVAQRAFRWSEARGALKDDPQRPRMDKMMADAARHGLADGYVFPLYGRRGLVGTFIISGQPTNLTAKDFGLLEALARQAVWRLLELRDGNAPPEPSLRVLPTKLTKREVEVLSFLCDGLTSREISSRMAISNHTVDWYMNGIQEKLRAKNRQHIVAQAFRYGLVA